MSNKIRSLLKCVSNDKPYQLPFVLSQKVLYFMNARDKDRNLISVHFRSKIETVLFNRNV